MKITLIKPGIGSIISGYNINEGSMEPLQLAILAGLVEEPDQVVLFDDRLEEIPFDEKTDLVAITVDSFSARRAYEISSNYRIRGVRVILGGMHVSLLPEEASLHADSIVVGDAEPVWKQIMYDFKNGMLQKIYTSDFGIPQDGCFPDRAIPLKVKWASQSSIDMTGDRELMRLMADSGCVGNLIGFESININNTSSLKRKIACFMTDIGGTTLITSITMQHFSLN